MSFKDYINVYEFETTLPGSGEKIKFKPLTTSDMKKLLIYEGEEDESVIEKALDDLISSTVITEGFDINECYIQDRFFLIVELRKKSKGEIYRFQAKCPQCNSQSLVAVNLDDLPITMPEKMQETISINKDISVVVGHIKRKEQAEASSMVPKQGTRTQKVTEMALFTHAAGIKKVITPDDEEIPSLEDRKFLLENVPTSNYDKIRNWFDENNFGVEFLVEYNCPTCGYKEVIDVPLDNFFL